MLTTPHKVKMSAQNKKIIHHNHIHNIHGITKHKQIGSYLKSGVYGGLDGIISTFAVVSGVAGAKLSAGIILILGFANLIADGISMAIGDYLSTKSEQEYQLTQRKEEEWEYDNYPKGEEKEIIKLYMKKGYTKTQAQKMISLLSKNKEAFVDTMMSEELNINKNTENPIKNGIVTFFSFVSFGVIPLFAFLGSKLFGWFSHNTFEVSIILTGIILFTLGAIKVKVTQRNWFFSGLETLVVGGLAAGAAYGIGFLLQGLA